jgi:hypothetical protein
LRYSDRRSSPVIGQGQKAKKSGGRAAALQTAAAGSSAKNYSSDLAKDLTALFSEQLPLVAEELNLLFGWSA